LLAPHGVKVPHIPKSGEDNVRSGFLALDGYEKVLAELPLSLKCMFVVAVDFTNRVIRFIRLQHRKPVPLAVPIHGDMDELLRRQKEYRDKSGHGRRRIEPGSGGRR
jgi:hypothetical protein